MRRISIILFNKQIDDWNMSIVGLACNKWYYIDTKCIQVYDTIKLLKSNPYYLVFFITVTFYYFQREKE